MSRVPTTEFLIAVDQVAAALETMLTNHEATLHEADRETRWRNIAIVRQWLSENESA